VTDSSNRRPRRGALRTFVVGGVVGGVIAFAAPRLRRAGQPDDQRADSGLEAFEGAPCWHHDRAREPDGEEAG
jgi:hypothetical protein